MVAESIPGLAGGAGGGGGQADWHGSEAHCWGPCGNTHCPEPTASLITHHLLLVMEAADYPSIVRTVGSESPSKQPLSASLKETSTFLAICLYTYTRISLGIFRLS